MPNKAKSLLRNSTLDTYQHIMRLVGTALCSVIKEEVNTFYDEQADEQAREPAPAIAQHVLPSCITPGLIVAKKVARRFEFEEPYQISLSNALRIAIYNEVIGDEDLEKLIKILEQIITTEGNLNKHERQALQDAMETLGSMYSKTRGTLVAYEEQPPKEES